MNGPQSIRYFELPMNSVSSATIHQVALAKSDGYGVDPCKTCPLCQQQETDFSIVILI